MANDFSGSDAVAWWLLNETSSNRADSSGNGNTLEDNNTVLYGTGNYYYNTTEQQSSNCADFESTSQEFLDIADSSLDSSFPIKSGGSGTFSLCFWMKAESAPAESTIISKYDYNVTSNRTFLMRFNNGATGIFETYIGISGSPYYETLDAAYQMSSNRWYHIGFTFNNTTKDWKLRIWDDTTQTVVRNVSGTASNNIQLGSASFAVGAAYASGSPQNYLDAMIDEVVVFDTDISTTDIDDIRNGDFGAVTNVDITGTASISTTTPNAADLDVDTAISGTVSISTTTPNTVVLSVSSVGDSFHLIAEGSGIGFSQNILKSGVVYGYSINITTVTSGGVQIKEGSNIIATYTTTGVKAGTFTASSTLFSVVSSAACNLTFDDIELSEVIVTSTSDTVELTLSGQVQITGTAAVTTSTPDTVALDVDTAVTGTAAVTTSTPDTVTLTVEGGTQITGVAAINTSTPDTVALAVDTAITAVSAMTTSASDGVVLSVAGHVYLTGVAAVITSTPPVVLDVSTVISAIAAINTSTTDTAVLTVTDFLTGVAAVTTFTPDTVELGVDTAITGVAAMTTLTSDIELGGTSVIIVVRDVFKRDQVETFFDRGETETIFQRDKTTTFFN